MAYVLVPSCPWPVLAHAISLSVLTSLPVLIITAIPSLFSQVPMILLRFVGKGEGSKHTAKQETHYNTYQAALF